MTRLRILHLIHRWQRRGAENFALQLAQALSSDKHTQVFCSVYAPADLWPECGIPMVNLDARRDGLGRVVRVDPAAILRLGRLLKEHQPDIVLAHGADTLKYATLAKFQAPRIPVIYRNVGFASYWVGTGLKRTLTRLLLTRVDLTVSVSKRAQQDFVQTFGLPESKTAMIPTAVDLAPFVDAEGHQVRQTMRHSLGLPLDEAVLIAVSSLTEEKNPLELVDLAAVLVGMDIRYHLVIAGDGPLRLPLQREAMRRGVEERVHLVGVRDDIPRLLAAADLMVLPSRTEGMPAALIEAGLAGLPCVAYDVGGVGEVIEHGVTGFLVRPGDRFTFQGSVARLLAEPERRAAMGTAARERCLEQFDMKKVAPQYEDLLRRSLDAGEVSPQLALRS